MRYLSHSFHLLAWSLCCLLFSQQASVAQQSAENKSIRAMEFSCVTWERSDFPTLHYLDAGEYRELDVTMGTHSKLYPISGVQALQLFFKRVGEDGEETYVLIGQAPLIGGTNRMLFIISKAEEGASLPLKLFGLDDSLRDFPAGSFRFLNFTPIPLKVTFNGESDRIQPQTTTIIDSKVSKGGGFLPFVVETVDGVKVFETRLYSQHSGRETVLIRPPKKGGKNIVVKFLPQVIVIPARP